MPQKVLNPLRTEAFGLQKTGNGVSKEMGVQMGEARIGVGYAGLYAERRHNAVDRPQRHRPVAIAEKDGPRFSTANEHEQITEILVINDGNDPCFSAFALADYHAFAFHIDVSHIESGEFTTTHAEPPECFEQTSIPKIVGAQGVPVAGVQKTTIRTFTGNNGEENEGLRPRLSWVESPDIFHVYRRILPGIWVFFHAFSRWLCL
jgi:hypothetical protein